MGQVCVDHALDVEMRRLMLFMRMLMQRVQPHHLNIRNIHSNGADCVSMGVQNISQSMLTSSA